MTEKVYWTIERHQFWKGLGKTCWSRHLGMFISDKYENMHDLMKYLEQNNPAIILRVVPENHNGPSTST